VTYIPGLLIYLLVYLAIAAIMLVPVLGVWFATRRMRVSRRSLVLVVVATLLLTPSLGPATIAVVPVPFGILFLTALFTWTWGELARWVTTLALGHAIAFPVTACLSYFLVGKLLLGQSRAGGSPPPSRN
jgi:hypothetical protein